MSGHRGYVFSSNRIVKALRKAGMVKHNKKDASPKTLFAHLGHVYKSHPELRQTMDCMVHAEEHFWMHNGQQIYFFEDAQFCKNIIRGTYSIKETMPLFHGNESFILMLPEQFALANVNKGSGLLVTIFRHTDRELQVFDNFFDSINQERANVEIVGEHGDWMICVSYQEVAGSDVYSRVAIPNIWIEAVCNMENLQQYIDHMKDKNRFDYFAGALLDSPELDYQFQIFRFVIGFLVYRHALPERIREGLPNKVAPHEYTSPFVPKPHTSIVSHPAKEKGEVQGHYRSWHFRQLTDDRYYKGEHEDKQKGSRIIFVSDSFVKKGEAHLSTVES